MFWQTVICFSCFKLLLIPSYRSTDFEVHRNWLAITHSRPFQQWYNESTSEWTLDYPPFFAWFEFVLSKVAYQFDPEMLKVENLNYASDKTVLFQRLSVIFTDLVLAYGTYKCCKCIPLFDSTEKEKGKKSSDDSNNKDEETIITDKKDTKEKGKGQMILKIEKVSRHEALRRKKKIKKNQKTPQPLVQEQVEDITKSKVNVLQVLIIANAGLFLVDHIHFQYNGFLFGILLISVSHILKGENLRGAFWFSVLLNFKHIFMYISPAYFVYLLRNYCFNPHLQKKRFIKLGLVVIVVFCVSFVPFACYGELKQVFTRLFPFKRGLCHAYWAPNFWSLYNVADKILSFMGKKLGFNIIQKTGVMTGGLVQEFNHVVLPTITPLVTFILTFVSILPALIKLWRTPGDSCHFLRCAILCGFCSFMFGWHVHEKAILIVIIPLSVLAVLFEEEAKMYKLLSFVGHYSLLPLIFTSFELPIKILIIILHFIFTLMFLPRTHDDEALLSCPFCSFSKLESLYMLGFIPLFVFENFVHELSVLKTDLPFLPLMLTSVYCSVGITYSWCRYYIHFLKYHMKSS